MRQGSKLIGGLLLALCAAPALAQTNTSGWAPVAPAGAPLPVFVGRAKAPDSVPVRAERKDIRRLPVGLKSFRFDGEWDEREWPVYLTDAQARDAASFQVVAQSSISVLPDASSLTLSINDTVVGRQRLGASSGYSKLGFDLPKGLLQSGFNLIRLKAEQRHRVDCSLPATYELLTAVKPEQTGLVFAGERGQSGVEHVADMAAIAPRGDGAAVIRILMTGKLTPDMAGRAIKASQIVAVSSGSLQPLVEFGPAGTDGSGLDLVVGSLEELRAIADFADFGAVTGPRYGFLPQRPNRPPTFVITGLNGADLDQAIERLALETQALKPRGTEAGKRAAMRQAGRQASGDREAMEFSEAGFGGAIFSGRLLRLGLDVAMPMDFMGADYDRMTLQLAGSYSDALDRDARVLVSINGANAAMQPLARSGARDLSLNRMFLPLGLMRPGLNRIDITAEVPAPADVTCLHRAGAEANRLQLHDRSELTLPKVARVGRAPDLAMTAAGGFPFQQEGARPILFVPNPDRATMSAAATLAARLAVAGRRPLDFAFTMTAPALDAGEVLMVSPAPTLDPKLMQAAGLDPERVRLAWRNERKKPGSKDLRPVALGAARHCDFLGEDPPAAAKVEAKVAPATPSFSLASFEASFKIPASLFGSKNTPDARTLEMSALSQSSVLTMSQAFPTDDARNLWTLVTAPDAALLKAGVDCLTHPGIWNSVSGRLSALQTDEKIHSVRDDEGLRYMAPASWSPGNLRLIGAAWLSLNAMTYVAACVGLALCLAASTMWLVLNVGRRVE